MAVDTYTGPESWTDRGMDWNNPDPNDFNYMAAIREAIKERLSVHLQAVPFAYVYPDVPRFSPLSLENIAMVNAWISYLVKTDSVKHPFVNREYESLPPRFWTLNDLTAAPSCRFLEHAGPGCTRGQLVEWFKAVYHALNKLTVIYQGRCYEAGRYGEGRAESGNAQDSVNEAIAKALGKVSPWPEDIYLRSLPLPLYSYSRCIDAAKDIDGSITYAGYAVAESWRVRELPDLRHSLNANLISEILLTPPNTKGNYEVQYSIFDSGSLGFAEGRTTRITPYTAGGVIDLVFGDADSIPRNEMVPVSDYEPEYFDGKLTGYNQVVGRLAETGYDGHAWILADYAVPGGFRFYEEG